MSGTVIISYLGLSAFSDWIGVVVIVTVLGLVAACAAFVARTFKVSNAAIAVIHAVFAGLAFCSTVHGTCGSARVFFAAVFTSKRIASLFVYPAAPYALA